MSEENKTFIMTGIKVSDLARAFYNSVDPEEEFGVSRFVSDRIYHLPTLLQNLRLEHSGADDIYIVSAEAKDSCGNAIKLEHRLRATCDEEATKIYEKLAAQLAGVQLKVLLSCWKIGNTLHRLPIFTCKLSDLMKVAHPNHNGQFSGLERVEFYEHLKSLEQTKLIFSQQFIKRNKKYKRTFEIPLLQIIGGTSLADGKYQEEMTISVMNLFPNPGKLAYVGAPIKNKTFELHADDTMLSTWIQVRKAQNTDMDHIIIYREDLVRLAGLQRTDESNSTVANKQLLKKLQRLYEKGSILQVPERIEKTVVVKIR